MSHQWVNLSLKDKIVLITGASAGIGKACAFYFAEQGAKIILCARRMEKLDEIALQIKQSYGVKTLSLQLDVTNQQQVETTLTQLPEIWSAVDILINNAGLALGLAKFQDAVVQDWNDMIDTNVKGLLYVTKALLPAMISRNSGHIVNLGSIAGHGVYSGGAVYCATKHAVDALTKILRLDVLGTEIRVTAISPGLVETDFSIVRYKGDKEKAKATYAGLQPLEAIDIANLIGYCVTAPAHVNINEIIVTPIAQAGIGAVHRHDT